METTAEVARLTTFQHHINDMRNLVICKICLKPLYEPFILGCGHTYCYGCLRSWFNGLDGRRKKKTCPDCRSEVESTPSPNYILRDLVHMFISRAELLPEDETVDEHANDKEEEAKLLASDKDSDSIFQGVFSKRPVHPLAVIGAIHDYEDGVDRCPICAWEIEDGVCANCGYEPDVDFQPWSDDEEEDEMSMMDRTHSITSDDESETTGYDSEHEVPPHFYAARSTADDVDHGNSTDGPSELGYGTPNPYYYDEAEEDDMDGFIDDHDGDEPDEVDEDDADDPVLGHVPRIRRPRYQVPDDDEESTSEDEDGEGEPYVWHQYGPTSPASNDESDSSEGDAENQDQLTNYDESEEESRSSTPVAPVLAAKRRPRIVSDSDDEEDEEEEEHRAQDQDSGGDDEADGDINDFESHTEGRSQSESAEGDESESSESEDATNPPCSSTSASTRSTSQIDNTRKRRRSPDAWRAAVRPRRDGHAERQALQYRAPYERQPRSRRSTVDISSS